MNAPLAMSDRNLLGDCGDGCQHKSESYPIPIHPRFASRARRQERGNLRWRRDDWQAGRSIALGRCAIRPERTCIELQVEVAVGDHLTDCRLLGSNPIETPSTRRNVEGTFRPPQSPLDAIPMPRERSFSFGAGSFGMSRFGWMGAAPTRRWCMEERRRGNRSCERRCRFPTMLHRRESARPDVT